MHSLPTNVVLVRCMEWHCMHASQPSWLWQSQKPLLFTVKNMSQVLLCTYCIKYIARNNVHNEIILCLFLCEKLIVEKMVLLVEGTHYKRREDQSSLSPHPSKAIVDCIF